MNGSLICCNWYVALVLKVKLKCSVQPAAGCGITDSDLLKLTDRISHEIKTYDSELCNQRK